MKKEKKMSINSKLVINNENFLENVAIILKAMKIKYNKEVSEYLKNLTKNTVDNFCEKSNKKNFEEFNIPLNNKDFVKVNQYYNEIQKILQAQYQKDNSYDKLMKAVEQPIKLCFTLILKKSLKFIEPKIENTNLFLDDNNKLLSSFFSLIGSTAQSGIFGCYMGDNAKSSLSIGENIKELKEKSTYISFSPSKENEDLFLNSGIKSQMFFQEQDCDNKWEKIDIKPNKIKKEPELER